MDRWRRKLVLRIRSLFHTRAVEAELDEELRFHLETRIEQGLARGLSQGEARRQAAIALGGIEQQKEACRDTRGVGVIEHMMRDMRHGARALRAQPGFALAAMLSLALGIGANTAIFQVLEAVRLRTLPVPRPDELVDVRTANGRPNFGVSEGPDVQATYALWEQIRERQRALSGVFAWGNTQFLISLGADPRVARTLWLSGNAPATLELRPALGRLFTPDEDRRGCEPVVVLSYPFWQSQFAGDRGVVGRTIKVLDRSAAVVGVTPPAFFGLKVGTHFDIAMPPCAAANWGSAVERRDWFWLNVMGRLKPGWSLDRAAADMTALSGPIFEATEPSGYSAERTAYYRGLQLTAVSASKGSSDLRDEYGDALWVLLAMTGLLLVLACTNIMNLLLARGTVRAHEISLRVAIGASRGRVIAQLFTESLLLAVTGSIVGAAIAHPLSARFVALLSTPGNPLYLDLQPHWTVLVFTIAIGTGACLLFGLLPALRASTLPPSAAMRGGGRGSTAGRERLVVQRALIVGQVVVSLVLVFGAGLFVRTFYNLANVDVGINRKNLIVARLGQPGRVAPEQAIARHDELLRTLRAVPGVASVASTTKVPLDGSSWTLVIKTPGMDPSAKISSKFTYVSPGYFTTVGMRLVAGRDLADTDRRGSRPVMVANQTFVRRYLGGENRLGVLVTTVAEPGYPETVYELVGVGTDAKYRGIRDEDRPIAYVPYAQHPSLGGWPSLVIRPIGPPEPVMAAVRRAAKELHPTLVIGFDTLDREVDAGLVRERLMAWLAAAFGVVAAFLAFIGIYGVISYVVQRRRHELAIRLALGAGRARIVRLVAGQLGVLLVIGLVLGVALALMLARGTSALLFGLSWHDPAAVVSSFALLMIVAAVACAVPALRASRIATNSALRSE